LLLGTEALGWRRSRQEPGGRRRSRAPGRRPAPQRAATPALAWAPGRAPELGQNTYL
jgi:hypothetical protein